MSELVSSKSSRGRGTCAGRKCSIRDTMPRCFVCSSGCRMFSLYWCRRARHAPHVCARSKREFRSSPIASSVPACLPRSLCMASGAAAVQMGRAHVKQSRSVLFCTSSSRSSSPSSRNEASSTSRTTRGGALYFFICSMCHTWFDSN